MTHGNSVEQTVSLLRALSERDETAALAILDSAAKDLPKDKFSALMRMAVHHCQPTELYVRRLGNIWRRNGKGSLKTATTPLSIEVLSDGTMDGLVGPLELYLAAFGIEADIHVGEYDAVQFEAYAGEKKPFDISFVCLSEAWLRRHVSSYSPLPEEIVALNAVLRGLVEGLSGKRRSLVVSEFVAGAWPVPGATIATAERRSWRDAVSAANATLRALAENGLMSVLDAPTAIHLAGGAAAVGQTSLIRMRAPFEGIGMLAVARELATAVAQLTGRSHRGLLLDWDNTLWGGEVGEVGSARIEVGPETPDGYAYQMLQAYIRDLNSQGVLLAAISRNDPKVDRVLEENQHLLLRRANFASLRLSWGDKSVSVQEAISDMNFGADLMVYVDDNHVDLAQVLDVFPEIDVVLAGPEAELTLGRLAGARFFNAVRLTDADMQRRGHAAALREQRDALSSASSKEEFLASLNIAIRIEGLNDTNRDRALQLLQKTNQFNLTTRRHGGDSVDRLSEQGAKIGVFNYTDRFGGQGIIGLMILMPRLDGWEIETWLMSCRVLNRGVEEQMLTWAKQQLRTTTLFGTYLPTEKNHLVSDLFPRMGFVALGDGHFSLEIVGESS